LQISFHTYGYRQFKKFEYYNSEIWLLKLNTKYVIYNQWNNITNKKLLDILKKITDLHSESDIVIPMQNVNLNKCSTNIKNKFSYDNTKYNIVDHEITLPQVY